MPLDQERRTALAPLTINLGDALPSLADEATGSAYSPLESLGRRVGLVRSNSQQVSKAKQALGPPSQLLPPQPRSASGSAARSSPLVFNTFRHSRSSSAGSTDYTASIYSTASADGNAYWAGPFLSSDVSHLPRVDSFDGDGQAVSDDDRTERGDPSDDDEDDAGRTEQGHAGEVLVDSWDRRDESPAETSFSSAEFTSSSRLSRFLDDSLVADSPIDDADDEPHGLGFGQQIPVHGINVGDVVPNLSSRAATQPLPVPEPASAWPRAGSVGARAQHAEGAVDVQSVYGLAGGTWQTVGRPTLSEQPSSDAPRRQLGQRTVSNFSRPRNGPAAAGSSSTGPATSSNMPSPLAPRPQRNASLRQAPRAVPNSQALPHDSTRATLAQPFRLSSSIPFPQQFSPPPHPKTTSPYPVSARHPRVPHAQPDAQPPPTIPKVVLLPSENQSLLRAQAPGHANPRPPHPIRGESHASASSNAGSLPSRKAPPPPVDRPGFSGPTAPTSATQTVRIPSTRRSPALVSTSRLANGGVGTNVPGELFVPPPAAIVSLAPASPKLGSFDQRQPPPLRVARQGSGETLYPGSYSIYSLPTTPTQPGGTYTKVEVGSPLASPDLQPSSPASGGGGGGGATAEQSLELGLAHFARANQTADGLALAAMHFRTAATVDGGCSGGMLLYGLALRSGWGVVKDERQGFDFLQRAADFGPAAAQPPSGPGGRGAAVVGSERVVAMLEVGTCLLRGWGCKKDPAKALSYFLVAARMGDPDSMVAAARCYEAGLGCPSGKKRKPEAARWYRRAIEAGAASAGQGRAWVWKKKYDEDDGAGG